MNEISTTMLESALRARTKGIAALDAGDVKKADRLLMHFAMDLLSVAVMSHEESEGRELLRDEIAEILPRMATVFEDMLALVNSGDEPARYLTGRYNYLVVAHIAHLLADMETASRIATIATQAPVPGTPFWDLYARAYDSLSRRERVEYKAPAARGEEKYWIRYVELMRAASEGIDLRSFQQTVRDAFESRNANKRLAVDAHEIEGTGKQPARWDFRAAALAELIAHNRQQPTPR